MTRRAWILMGALAALWGASYMFIEIAIDDVSDLFLVFARTLLGALVLAPVALARGAFGPARAAGRWLLFVAAVQIVGPFLLITTGQHHVTSSMAGILIASAPIYTAIITAAAVKSERLDPIGGVGVAIGILGIVLLFGVDLGSSTEAILGGLAILLAGLGYAIGAIVAKRRLKDVPPVGVAASIMGLSALILLPALPWTVPAEAPGLGAVGALVALGAGGTGVAFLIFYILNAEIGPSRASIVAYIAPVFSVFYGVTLLDESFTVATAAGLVLILGGSWLAADGRLPWRRKAPVVPAEAAAAPAR
jgi:drug/metabolite transporter (DMT)-like permease